MSALPGEDHASGGKRQALMLSNSSALFVEQWQDPVLAKHIVGLIGKPHPVICHIGAANGDSPAKTDKFYALAMRVGFEPRHLNLFALEDDKPDTFFDGVDGIYIDGGSTRNLRDLLKELYADRALRDAYNSGQVIIGASAGANIMFEWGMTDSVRTRIEPTRGLGLLPGSISVHSDVRADRVESFARYLASADARFPAYALDDGTCLHFVNEALAQCVTSNPNAQVRQHKRDDPSSTLLVVQTLPAPTGEAA